MKKNPVRMCIACRKRESQTLLIRLQYIDDRIVPYSGRGRSIYLCGACSREPKKIRSVAKRHRVDAQMLANMLKEFEANG